MEIHGVYASTSGNTELVLETIQSYWADSGVNLVLHRAEQTPISLFHQNEHFLLATSTWEHGVINPLFLPLLKELKVADLSGKTAAIVGCGDRRYEPVLFCEGANELRRLFEAQGGQTIGETLKIDGDPYRVLEKEVRNWADEMIHVWQTLEIGDTG